MCGIGGTVLPSRHADDVQECLRKIQVRLRHRGPDDEGLYVDSASSMGFVHTRLSIIDLSALGHQPMLSADGRYIIVFNGEIYNFRELRRDLESSGFTFKSHSDTEVILRLFQRDGTHCVKKLEGMFAFAIWDTVERSCFLARDPLGIKPLYIWQRDGSLAFASELRAVLEANLGPRLLNSTALQGYFLFGSVQEPETLVEGIETLPAGHWMEWKEGESRTVMYWDLRLGGCSSSRHDEKVGRGSIGSNGTERRAISMSEAVATTRAALLESVRKHHVSDVPVNLFLSGGLDSTALLGLSKTCGFDNLSTFSISFDDPNFNEGELAARTAKHFGTNHHDWRMCDDDGRKFIRQFLETMDQPSNDGFNSFCISKFAHDGGAKVVLSGLGGDELFGGYPSFQQLPKLQRLYQLAAFAGGPSRNLIGAGMQRFASPRYRRLGAFLRSGGNSTVAYWAMRGFFLPDEVQSLVERYSGNNAVNKYELSFGSGAPEGWDPKDSVSFLETTRYMRNQLLRDSDVMSMAWGLELRVPFVDHRLIDSISSIPAAIRLASGKRLLRDAVTEIPEWIRTQSKRGFRFPFEAWMTRQWCDLFKRINQTSPVELNSWFRIWTIFTLEHFLRTNQIQDAKGQSLDLVETEVVT